jgi:hypothetical protein
VVLVVEELYLQEVPAAVVVVGIPTPHLDQLVYMKLVAVVEPTAPARPVSVVVVELETLQAARRLEDLQVMGALV